MEVEKYFYREEEGGWVRIYQGKTMIATLNPILESPCGVADGICKTLNIQDKYILPTKLQGGGFIRKLTKQEKTLQQEFIQNNWKNGKDKRKKK